MEKSCRAWRKPHAGGRAGLPPLGGCTSRAIRPAGRLARGLGHAQQPGAAAV